MALNPNLLAMVTKARATYVPTAEDDIPDHALDDPEVLSALADVVGHEEGLLFVPGGDRAAALQDARQRLKAAIEACNGRSVATAAS